ncbi:hypothetical protein GCM10025864_22940 [Luteimicrobium album]|uniref:Uncharacterized protein n=1 Tax=Luteimicrobium album TaxID=1054550 RepID=A0ABQ6I1A4_9MICO|nr:hypothetical protein GCM10025864_22940 [Luteimicrobium album]
MGGYFDPLLAFVAGMRDRGFTHPRYVDMLVVADDVDDALERLRTYRPPARSDASPGAEMADRLAAAVAP